MDELLTEEEAAAALGISLSTLRTDRYAGTGPRYVQKIKRGRIHYRASDLDRWLDENTHDPAKVSEEAGE